MKRVAVTKNGVAVWQDEDEQAALLYVSGMHIDGDGSPHAYHPKGIGLDYNANAYDKDRGKWVGVVTDAHGNPVVQGDDDLAPGYYISPTTVSDKTITHPTARRYVNAEEISFIAFPGKLLSPTGGADVERLHIGVNLGDYVIVYHIKKKVFTGAIFADVGPRYKLGEASIRVAKNLGVPPSPKNGGEDHCNVMYLIFPRTHETPEWPLTEEAIQEKARELFDAWGGVEQLEELLPTVKTASFAPDGSEQPAKDLPTAEDRIAEARAAEAEATHSAS